MKKAKIILFSAFLGTALFLSCGDAKPIEFFTEEEKAAILSGGKITKDKVTGLLQKGPFLPSATVTLFELNSSLAQTGRSFTGTITGNDGSFEVSGIELVSPYVLLSVNGYYRNEITGATSAGTITLQAIADIGDKSSVNVNLLTHLEYDRVLRLVQSGKSLSEAKSQAQLEILNVFGIDAGFAGSDDISIFGSSDASAALLAISILLQGNRAEGDFSALLTEFSQAIKESGTWSNAAKKTEIADWASSVNLEGIRGHIGAWGLPVAVPGFEEYVNAFAEAWKTPGDGGAALCDGEPYDAENEFCHDYELYAKCGDASGNGKHDYNPDTQFCFNNYTVEKCNGKEYNLISQRCYYGVVQTECGNNLWYNDELQGCCNNAIYTLSTHFCYENATYSCGNKPYNPSTHFCAADNKIYAKCGGAEYNPATHFCYDNATYSCGNKPYDPSTHLCDGRDYKTYKYVTIGTQVWMAENLNYAAGGIGVCFDNDSSNCTLYGRVYDWATAMDINTDYNSTYWNGSGANHQGICPGGWHISSDVDWIALVNAVESVHGSGTAGIHLKAASGWNSGGNGLDTYGFAALPGGFGNPGVSLLNDGNVGYWWITTEGSASKALYRSMGFTTETVGLGSYDKPMLFSVRCVKDYAP
uniref:SclB protein n=1 Tax=uncultured bacterium contig00016 TaxID=1181507 RepID=A0A806K013_9BACT|nr:SclB protein [uncultured bacterium contig00016]